MAPALRWGEPFSWDDLEEIPDDGHRYELVDGVLFVTPAPSRAHQTCVARMIALLLAAAGPEHLVLPAPFDWKVSHSTAFQPDVVVARAADVGEARLERTPLLVVEVLSPRTRLIDLGTKRLAYDAAGVPAYWLVDPLEPSLTVLQRQGERLVEVATVAGDEPYRDSQPFPVTVVPRLLV